LTSHPASTDALEPDAIAFGDAADLGGRPDPPGQPQHVQNNRVVGEQPPGSPRELRGLELDRSSRRRKTWRGQCAGGGLDVCAHGVSPGTWWSGEEIIAVAPDVPANHDPGLSRAVRRAGGRGVHLGLPVRGHRSAAVEIRLPRRRWTRVTLTGDPWGDPCWDDSGSIPTGQRSSVDDLKGSPSRR